MNSGGGDDYVDSSTYNSAVQLRGGDGNDVLIGSDYITRDPERAMDQLYGGPGDDEIYGGRSGERIWPGPGDDVVRAGAHNGWSSTVYFFDAPDGVTVDLEKHLAVGHGRDRLWNIDGVHGSVHNDVLFGDSGGNWLLGCGGADVMHGRGGPDFLQGDDFDREPEDCPGDPSVDDIANGGRGWDVCAAEEMDSCEVREGDLPG